VTLHQEAVDFYLRQKTTVAAMTGFIEWFNEVYSSLRRKDQELVGQCMQHIFRKYYYSPCVIDTFVTPANIANTLVRREFGNEVMVVPGLEVKYEGKRVAGVDWRVTGIGLDEHYAMRDLEYLLDRADSGVALHEPGIPLLKETERLKRRVFIRDPHYVNFLSLLALEAGLMERVPGKNGEIGKATSKAKEFLRLGEREKFSVAVDGAIQLCSRMMQQAEQGEATGAFTTSRIKAYLKSPRNLESIFKGIFKRYGFDLAELADTLSPELDGIGRYSHMEEKNLVHLLYLVQSFEMFFVTTFGYYLQLIQPLYTYPYDIDDEIDNLLSFNDPQIARFSLFSPAETYDLTALGESLFLKGKKAKNQQELLNELGDDAMYELFQDGQYGFGSADKDDLDWEDDVEQIAFDFDWLGEILDKAPSETKPDKANRHRNKRRQDAHDPLDDKVFVFRVKVQHNKRIWREIEVKGDQTLHHLHNAVLASYPLDRDHLYSFYMSNKAWDASTEYSHPEADGRSATKARISKLGLSPKQKFLYLYDYGDAHRFEVEFRGMKDPEEGIRYPWETKRNKPRLVPCEECDTGEPIRWFCHNHEVYLCDRCHDSDEHRECYVDEIFM